MATESDPFSNNVSVIVLNYNQAATTVECLDALARARSDLIREIVVVDNGSDPVELAILHERHAQADFVLVEVGVNRFFGEGNNIGVDHAHGDYIVFLNNDAFVQPGWIEALCSTMRSDPLVAAVGPMFLYPDGRVQEVGGVIVPTGDAVQIGKGAVWGPDHYDTPCPVDYCSAACLMMRRADFLKVGGFGLEWEPAYYEDTDLCLKLWTQCGKVMVNPKARVVHIESKTTSDRRLQLHDISEINRARFVKKWGHWLEARQTSHLANLALAPRSEIAELGTHGSRPAPGHADGPRLAVRPVLPLPARSGRGRTDALRTGIGPLRPGGDVQRGVRLPSALQHHSDPPDRGDVRIRQCHRHRAPVGDGGARQLPVRRRHRQLDRASRAGLRHTQRVPHPVPVLGARPHRRGVRGWLAGYDEIWAYSEFVRRNVNGLIRHYGLDAPPIRLIPPHAMWSGPTSGLPWPERRTILTVGRFFTGGHNKRQDVVIEAFRRMPESDREGMELALAGAIHPSPEGRARFHELQSLAEGLNCSFHPNIGRADLAALYGRSAVLIHAAGFGVDADEFPERLEHFGITPIEAASFGCIPVVYGQGGPREVVRTLGCETAFDTVDECARIVSQLLADPDGSARLSAHLLESCQAYSDQAYAGGVGESLRDLGVL